MDPMVMAVWRSEGSPEPMRTKNTMMVMIPRTKMLSARFELAIFRVSGERIDQLSHESEPLY